jgi:hypothetical protein
MKDNIINIELETSTAPVVKKLGVEIGLNMEQMTGKIYTLSSL